MDYSRSLALDVASVPRQSIEQCIQSSGCTRASPSPTIFMLGQCDSVASLEDLLEFFNAFAIRMNCLRSCQAWCTRASMRRTSGTPTHIRHYFFSQPALLTGKHIDIPFTPEKLWKPASRKTAGQPFGTRLRGGLTRVE